MERQPDPSHLRDMDFSSSPPPPNGDGIARLEKPIGKKHRSSETSSATLALGLESFESNVRPIQKKTQRVDSYGEVVDRDVDGMRESPIKKRRTEGGGLSLEALHPEEHAREKLLRYIAKKEPGIPREMLDKIIISCSLKPNKYPGDTYDETNYVITYEYRGSLYSSRPEVLAAMTSKPKNKPFSGRQEAHMVAKANLEGLKLPKEYRNVGSTNCDQLLIAVGQLRSSFCNPVQLYPAGYELHIYSNRGTASEIVLKCSILDNDGELEFLIVGNHGTVKGVTEDDAWQQVLVPDCFSIKCSNPVLDRPRPRNLSAAFVLQLGNRTASRGFRWCSKL